MKKYFGLIFCVILFVSCKKEEYYTEKQKEAIKVLDGEFVFYYPNGAYIKYAFTEHFKEPVTLTRDDKDYTYKAFMYGYTERQLNEETEREYKYYWISENADTLMVFHSDVFGYTPIIMRIIDENNIEFGGGEHATLYTKIQ